MEIRRKSGKKATPKREKRSEKQKRQDQEACMGRLRGGISKRKQKKSSKPIVFTMDLEEHTDHVQSSFVSHSRIGRRHRSTFISRVWICSWKFCRFRDAKGEIRGMLQETKKGTKAGFSRFESLHAKNWLIAGRACFKWDHPRSC